MQRRWLALPLQLGHRIHRRRRCRARRLISPLLQSIASVGCCKVMEDNSKQQHFTFFCFMSGSAACHCTKRPTAHKLKPRSGSQTGLIRQVLPKVLDGNQVQKRDRRLVHATRLSLDSRLTNSKGSYQSHKKKNNNNNKTTTISKQNNGDNRAGGILRGRG